MFYINYRTLYIFVNKKRPIPGSPQKGRRALWPISRKQSQNPSS